MLWHDRVNSVSRATSHAGPVGYRGVLSEAVSRRLLITQSISEMGDFVGLSALLILTYRETGAVVGPGAVFAARAFPALFVGTVASGWLERPERRSALVTLALIGAAVVTVVAVEPTLTIALCATAVLGATRTAAISVTAGAIVDAVPLEVRGGYFALSSTVNQASQVVGFLGGTAITLGLGVPTSLGLDAASFVAAAFILRGLPPIMKTVRKRRPLPTAGVRTLLAQPVLRLVGPVVWVGACGTALPETIAPSVTHGAELGVVMASFPFGMMIAASFSAHNKGRVLNRVMDQLRTAVAFGLAFGLGAVVLYVWGGSWLLAAANLLLGMASVWVIGVRTTFARFTPPGHMVQVEAVMVAAIVLGEGLGTLGLAFVADAAGPGASYAIMAGLTTCMAVLALRRARHVQGLDTDPMQTRLDGVI